MFVCSFINAIFYIVNQYMSITWGLMRIKDGTDNGRAGLYVGMKRGNARSNDFCKFSLDIIDCGPS